VAQPRSNRESSLITATPNDAGATDLITLIPSTIIGEVPQLGQRCVRITCQPRIPKMLLRMDIGIISDCSREIYISSPRAQLSCHRDV